MRKQLKLLLILLLFNKTAFAKDLLEGVQYKTLKEIYLHADYKNSNEKSINKETAVAYLSGIELAKRHFTAFQDCVSEGAIVTILGKAPKPWYLYFNSDKYFVKLNPDLSRGLDVILPLDGRLKGSVDGLNSEIFKKMEVHNN